MIIYEYDLDVTPGGVPVCVNLSQYDQNYILKFRLYSRQGYLDIKSGTTVRIRGTKRDGNGYSADAIISGNVITVSGDKQMTAVAGKQFFELQLESDEKELNTANFIVCVERAPMDKDTVKSESVIKELENAEELANKIIESAKETESCIKKAAEEVSNYADAAATKAGEAAGSAREAAGSASQAAQSAGAAEDYSKESESHSHGSTGIRPGEDTDNSRYYSEQSRKEYERAKEEADRAEKFSGFVKPQFLLANNRLYLKRGSTVSFIVANNRLYYKISA